MLGDLRVKPTKSRKKSTAFPPRLVTPTNDIRGSGVQKRPGELVGSVDSVGFHHQTQLQRQRKKNTSHATETTNSSQTEVRCVSCTIARTTTVRDRWKSHLGGFKRSSMAPNEIPSAKEEMTAFSVMPNETSHPTPSAFLLDPPGTVVLRSFGSNSFKEKGTLFRNPEDTSPINAFADKYARMPRLDYEEGNSPRIFPDFGASTMSFSSPSTVLSSSGSFSTSEVVVGVSGDFHPVRSGLSSEAVIGVAVGCVLVFWLIIGPIICLLLRKSLQSQTKLFQRQEAREYTGNGSILMQEVEIRAMEKARLFHPDYPPVESSHPIRYPSVYAPLPQAPLSPSHLQDGGGFQVLAIPCSGHDRHPDSHSAICLSDNVRDSRYSETTSNESTALSMADEYCPCSSAEEYCFGVRPSLAHLPVFPNGHRWELQKVGYEGRIVADLRQSNADSASMTTPGYAAAHVAPCRRFPKMGQTCLRSSYASRSRGGQHQGAAVPNWSSVVDFGRPRPEGRARSDERMEDEVLINRCARTPVGYRRIPRAGSVSPRCRSKRLTCVEPT